MATCRALYLLPLAAQVQLFGYRLKINTRRLTGQLVRQGLQQPFQDAYQTARKQVIAGTIGTGLLGLLAGFLLGRYVRGERK